MYRGPWVAKAQGIEVKDRGRIPAELVVKCEAATGNLGPDIETSGGSPGKLVIDA